jgi:hypothetical protein
LDALIQALRLKNSTDKALLEAEERSAARARARVQLVAHVHR